MQTFTIKLGSISFESMGNGNTVISVSSTAVEYCITVKALFMDVLSLYEESFILQLPSCGQYNVLL